MNKKIAIFGGESGKVGGALASLTGQMLTIKGALVHVRGLDPISEMVIRGAYLVNPSVRTVCHTLSSDRPLETNGHITEVRMATGSVAGDYSERLEKLMMVDAFIIIGQSNPETFAEFEKFITLNSLVWPAKKKLAFLCRDIYADLDGFNLRHWRQELGWFDQYIEVTSRPVRAMEWVLN